MKRIRLVLLTGLFLISAGLTENVFAQFKQVGKASFYHDRFAGRRTTSGERYNPNKFTAAHRTLPFGTYLRVTVVKTGKVCIVKVNDRGPFVNGRILDLSKAAAKQLGMISSGMAKVAIEVIDPSILKDSTAAPKDKDSIAGAPSIFLAISQDEIQDMNRQTVRHKGYTIQLHSADSYDKAYEFANSINTSLYIPLYIWMVTDGKQYYYRVIAGNFKKKADAQKGLVKCVKVVPKAFIRPTK